MTQARHLTTLRVWPFGILEWLNQLQTVIPLADGIATFSSYTYP